MANIWEPESLGEGQDRITAALQPEQWRDYSALLKKRLGFEEEENNPFVRFSYAWALFQCERFREAIEEFRSLDQMTLSGKHRVRRLATWCDSAGRPITCNGKVREVYQNAERGVVYCPQVRSEIDFLPKEFAQADVDARGPSGRLSHRVQLPRGHRRSEPLLPLMPASNSWRSRDGYGPVRLRWNSRSPRRGNWQATPLRPHRLLASLAEFVAAVAALS